MAHTLSLPFNSTTVRIHLSMAAARAGGARAARVATPAKQKTVARSTPR